MLKDQLYIFTSYFVDSLIMMHEKSLCKEFNNFNYIMSRSV